MRERLLLLSSLLRDSYFAEGKMMRIADIHPAGFPPAGTTDILS
jgi:hypothetical protein